MALIATFNPTVRRARIAPARHAQERATLAAVGGALGSLVILVAALFSGPLFDALEVSRASARVAIGIVAAGAGLVRMFRRLPSAQQAPGRPQRGTGTGRDPYVATPALILLGLSAGADRGVAFVALALVIAVAVLIVQATWLDANGRAGQLVGWAARLLGAVAVATSVLLVIDGVLAV